jgi:acetylornithine deacetylase/succinyl-diaminopimelate desuccinylase-like protein
VPGVDINEARAEVTSRLEDVTRRWGDRGTSFLYDVLDTSEPIELPEGLPIVSRLSDALGTPFEPAGMPSWTDAGNLLTKHGVPCVIFGAGELGPAHSDDEWVSLGDLVRLADTLRRLISGTRR